MYQVKKSVSPSEKKPPKVLTLTDIRNSVKYHEITLQEALQKYSEWIKQDIFAVCQKFDEKTNTSDFNGFLLPKRGNRAWRSKIHSKHAALFKIINGNKNLMFIKGNSGLTNAFHITLTYGRRKCRKCKKLYELKKKTCPRCGCKVSKIITLKEAWKNVSGEINNFFRYLEHKYGKIVKMRVFEAFEDGFPHVHAILIFKEHKFQVTKYRSRETKKIYYKLNDKELGIFQRAWHSYIMVKGIYSANGLNYVLKYVTKNHIKTDNCKTLAYTWFFKKQLYSISKDFLGSVTNLVAEHDGVAVQLDARCKHNSALSKTAKECRSIFIGLYPVKKLRNWNYNLNWFVENVEKIPFESFGIDFDKSKYYASMKYAYDEGIFYPSYYKGLHYLFGKAFEFIEAIEKLYRRCGLNINLKLLLKPELLNDSKISHDWYVKSESYEWDWNEKKVVYLG